MNSIKVFVKFLFVIALVLFTGTLAMAQTDITRLGAPAPSTTLAPVRIVQPTSTMQKTTKEIEAEAKAMIPPKRIEMKAPVPERDLVAGLRNDTNVKEVQTFLRDSGFLKATPDGSFGPMTARAVKDFQRKNNIRETGIVDAKTRQAINVFRANAEAKRLKLNPPSRVDLKTVPGAPVGTPKKQ